MTTVIPAKLPNQEGYIIRTESPKGRWVFAVKETTTR